MWSFSPMTDTCICHEHLVYLGQISYPKKNTVNLLNLTTFKLHEVHPILV